MYSKITTFIREVKSEIDKVTWPNRNELIASTMVVVVLVVIIALYIGFVDFILSWLLSMVVQ